MVRSSVAVPHLAVVDATGGNDRDSLSQMGYLGHKARLETCGPF